MSYFSNKPLSKIDQSNPYPKNSNVKENEHLDIDGGFVRFKPMITPKDVIQFGLVGVPKVFPMTGEEITEEYVALYLQSAINELEMQGLVLSPIISFHVDDAMGSSFFDTRYFPTLLKRYPVRKIISFELRYPNAGTENASLVYRVPEQWITFENNKVNVIPKTGYLMPTSVSGSAQIPLTTLFTSRYRPSAYRIEYLAGFDQDQLPVIVWQLLNDMATFNLLSAIAPLLFPTTGLNVGVDGLSQSTQLAGPAIFNGRLQALEEKIKNAKHLVFSYYGQGFSIEFAGL